MNDGQFWTSGQDLITKFVWLFRGGGILSQLEPYKNTTNSLDGLPDLAVHKVKLSMSNETTCVTAMLTDKTSVVSGVSFSSESCLGKRPFICQQFLE